MEKKYKLKNETTIYNEDGSNNGEHILDVVQQIDVLFSNIQDNNAICLQMFEQTKDNLKDEDTARAMGLVCENMDEIIERAQNLYIIIEKAKENLKNFNKDNERDFTLILGEMQMLEERSRKLMESMF